MKAFAKDDEDETITPNRLVNENDAPCMGSQFALSLRDGYVVAHVYGCKYIIYTMYSTGCHGFKEPISLIKINIFHNNYSFFVIISRILTFSVNMVKL